MGELLLTHKTGTMKTKTILLQLFLAIMLFASCIKEDVSQLGFQDVSDKELIVKEKTKGNVGTTLKGGTSGIIDF